MKHPFNTLAANDQSLLYPAFPGAGARDGLIYAANDANFDASHLSEPLTNYIVGATEQDNLRLLLDRIAPPIMVSRAFTYRTHETKEDFQSDADDNADVREIGGDFGMTRRTGTQVNGRTVNKGLTMVIDNDAGGEDPMIQQAAVKNLTDRLMRSELARAVASLEANDTAASSVNWGPTNTTADPDSDILNLIETSGDKRGLNPNILLIGGAWVRRLIALRRANNPGGYGTGAMTSAQLAEYFGLDDVIILPTRYQSSSTAKSKILTTDLFTYFARPGMMVDDPSNLKRFVTPAGGGMVRVYITSQLKKTLVTVEHYSTITCTSTIGIEKLPTTFT